MNAETWIAVASVIVAAAAIGIPLRYQTRRDARQDARQAIADATAPLISERDYLRTQLAAAQRRNEELEDELRRRDD